MIFYVRWAKQIKSQQGIKIITKKPAQKGNHITRFLNPIIWSFVKEEPWLGISFIIFNTSSDTKGALLTFVLLNVITILHEILNLTVIFKNILLISEIWDEQSHLDLFEFPFSQQLPILQVYNNWSGNNKKICKNSLWFLIKGSWLHTWHRIWENSSFKSIEHKMNNDHSLVREKFMWILLLIRTC